jgi:hypothetical protein
MWATRRATAADHAAVRRLFAELGVPDPPPFCRSSTTNVPSSARAIWASDGATAFGKMYLSIHAVPWRRLLLFAIVWTRATPSGLRHRSIVSIMSR